MLTLDIVILRKFLERIRSIQQTPAFGKKLARSQPSRSEAQFAGGRPMPALQHVFAVCLGSAILIANPGNARQKPDSPPTPGAGDYPAETVELLERQAIPDSRIIRNSFHINIWRLQLKTGFWYSRNMDSYANDHGFMGGYFAGRLKDDEIRDLSRQLSQLDLEKLPAQFELKQDGVRNLPDLHHYILKVGDRETAFKHVPLRPAGETVADNLKRAATLLKDDQKESYQQFMQACTIAASFVDARMAPKKKKKRP
jgi:hypothetical protein